MILSYHPCFLQLLSQSSPSEICNSFLSRNKKYQIDGAVLWQQSTLGNKPGNHLRAESKKQTMEPVVSSNREPLKQLSFLFEAALNNLNGK
jgi:hypothetical protein